MERATPPAASPCVVPHLSTRGVSPGRATEAASRFCFFNGILKSDILSLGAYSNYKQNDAVPPSGDVQCYTSTQETDFLQVLKVWQTFKHVPGLGTAHKSVNVQMEESLKQNVTPVKP